MTTTTDATASAPTEEAGRVEERTSRRPRGAIIINPYSSGMTASREREIVTTLREHLDLEVRRTERGGHAPALTRELMEAGDLDVVISCGGDGTANEIVNGMSLGADSAGSRPAFAIVPAGGTNVFARSIGLPNHPVRATERIARAIAERRTERINLGVVDERLFLFAAGVGLDAEVVKRIEQRRSGRRPSDLAHLTSIVGIFATSRWALGDRMTVRIEDTGEELRSALLMVANTNPFTYMGRVPIQLMPDARLDAGLDLMAPSRATAFFAMRNAAQAMGVGRAKQRLVSAERRQLRHDLRSFVVECDEPQPVQVDGEFIGDRTHIRFGVLEHAIDLVVA